MVRIKTFQVDSHLVGEDGFGFGSGVDAAGLDRNDKVTARLEEVVRVERDNTRLIGLGNVSKDAVDHADKHSVLPWVACVLDDGHYEIRR